MFALCAKHSTVVSGEFVRMCVQRSCSGSSRRSKSMARRSSTRAKRSRCTSRRSSVRSSTATALPLLLTIRFVHTLLCSLYTIRRLWCAHCSCFVPNSVHCACDRAIFQCCLRACRSGRRGQLGDGDGAFPARRHRRHLLASARHPLQPRALRRGEGTETIQLNSTLRAHTRTALSNQCVQLVNS